MLKARGDARSLLSDSCTIRFVHCLLFRYRRSSFLWLFIMRDRLDVDRLSVLARYHAGLTFGEIDFERIGDFKIDRTLKVAINIFTRSRTWFFDDVIDVRAGCACDRSKRSQRAYPYCAS